MTETARKAKTFFVGVPQDLTGVIHLILGTIGMSAISIALSTVIDSFIAVAVGAVYLVIVVDRMQSRN